MFELAVRSVRRHRAAAIATGVVAFFGTVLVAGMAGLLGTGLAGSAPGAAGRDFLIQFPLILGGWIVAIVVFAMVSTIGVALDGRTGEIAGLRLIGATPPQVRRLITVETLVISLAGVLPGVVAGVLGGGLVTAVVRAAGLIDPGTVYAPGLVLPLVAGVVVLIASAVAAWLGSRGPARRAPVGGDAGPGRNRRSAGRVRRIAAGALVVAGAGSSLSVLGFPPDDVATTALTGPGCVLLAVAGCVFAPELIALANRVFGPLRSAVDAPAHLAATNLAVAPERVRPAVTFVTLLVGVAAGTLSMQNIENHSRAAAAGGDGELIASINYLVVILIAAFVAIALVNNLISAITRRAPEFASLRLIGATAGQSLRMVVTELTAATLIGVLAGWVGAFLAVLPFALVKTGDPLAPAAPVPFLVPAAVAAVLVSAVSLLVGGRIARA